MSLRRKRVSFRGFTALSRLAGCRGTTMPPAPRGNLLLRDDNNYRNLDARADLQPVLDTCARVLTVLAPAAGGA